MAGAISKSTFSSGSETGAAAASDAAGRLKIWRLLALLLALYVVGQDGMRVLRFSLLDPAAGTFAITYARAPEFKPGYVEVLSVNPDGPMGRAGIVAGDHIRFDDDVRNDAVPIVGEWRNFTLDHAGSARRLKVAAVPQRAELTNSALNRRSLLIALSGFVAGLFALFIIWRGGRNLAALLLGVSLAAYSLVNSAPWIWFDSPLARELLNFFGRLIQTLSSVSFIGFALVFYADFVGPVRRVAWQLLGLYAAALFLLLCLSDLIDGLILLLPVLGEGQDLYTFVRLAGSVAALVIVAVGWRRCRSETQQRFAMLFAALMIMVGSRVLYLAHLYFWQGAGRQYSGVELALAMAGTGLSAPLFAYAILRQKVLDLGFVINRTLIYGIISSGLLLVFGLVEWASERLLPKETIEASAVVNAGVALTIFVVFHRIRDFVERIVERLLFRSWHESEAKLRRFVRDAALIAKPPALMSASVEALAQFAQGAGCSLYLKQGEGYVRSQAVSAQAPQHIDGDDPLAVALRADPKPLHPADEGSAIPAALALPMLLRGQLDGFFLLGAKPEGDSYRPDEIELLGWAAQQIGLDLRALRVAELEHTNAALAIRVDELRALIAAQGGQEHVQKPA